MRGGKGVGDREGGDEEGVCYKHFTKKGKFKVFLCLLLIKYFNGSVCRVYASIFMYVQCVHSLSKYRKVISLF